MSWGKDFPDLRVFPIVAEAWKKLYAEFTWFPFCQWSVNKDALWLSLFKDMEQRYAGYKWVTQSGWELQP